MLLALYLASSVQTLDQLGKQLFFDPRLSTPVGQSCASCHSPKHGFAAPDATNPISPGAIATRKGNRNAPTISYSQYVPAFHLDPAEGIYVGGLFLDGRANTLEEQALGPLLNPVEMNNASIEEVLQKLKKYGYTPAFEKIFGKGALDHKHASSYLANALASYERSREVNPFSSKYDAYLAGKVKLSAQEQRGLELFEAEDKGNCAACHISQAENKQPPQFTDFTYDNLGTPANPKLALSTPDTGLAQTTGQDSEAGLFRVPTLRNIALTAPYMHNGVFDTLKQVVDFYNTRDVEAHWGKAEITQNVNTEELGNLKLSADEVDAIVAFMETLNDGYQL